MEGTCLIFARIETLKYILTGILAKPASAAELSGAVSALGLIGVIQGAGQDVYYESIIDPIMDLISVHGGRRAKKGRGKYATAVPEVSSETDSGVHSSYLSRCSGLSQSCASCAPLMRKRRERYVPRHAIPPGSVTLLQLLAFNIDILHMPQLLDAVRTATLQSIGVLVSTFTKSEIVSSLWPTMAGCLLGHLEHPAVPVRVGAGRLAAMLYETGFIRVVDPDAAEAAEPMPTDPVPVAGGGDAPPAAFEGVAEIYGPASAYKSLRQISAGNETTADTGDSGFDSEGMGPVTDGATELTSEYDSDASDSDEDQDDGEDDFVGFGIVGLKKSIKSVARAKAAAAREWAWWTTIGADSIEEAARTPLADIETELKTVAAELARDSSHQRSKKDKKWLRAEFRRIMDTLVMSQRSHEDMKLRSHVLSLDGWPKLVQADALRQLLAGGFDIQLE